ncbi:MAG: hypothetical protein AAB967_01205 [Patescibacteria group bacterium]
MTRIGKQVQKYFWDVDTDTLDPGKHKRYIIERILEMGDETAARWLRSTFSNEDIRGVVKRAKGLSKKSICFWQLMLGR